MAQQVHRASTLKQNNKKHNVLGHKTKGQVKALIKGRLSYVSISRKVKHELSRQERRNQVKVVRADKREKTMNKKRKLGTDRQPPFLVCVVVLSPDINPRQVVSALSKADDQATINVGQQGATHISCARFKQRYTVVVPPVDDLYAILDSLKVCTTMLLVWPTSSERGAALLQEEHRQLLSCILAQGLPTVLHATIETEELSQKKKAVACQNVLSEIRQYFPGEAKVHALDKPGQAMLCLRQIGSQKQRPLFYRDHRPHLIADALHFIEDADSPSTGTLQVSGYLRGVRLSVNGLVHVTGWGDYQLSRLTVATDPNPVNTLRDCIEDPDVVTEPDPDLQESLIAVKEEKDEESFDDGDDSGNEEDGDNASLDDFSDDDEVARSLKGFTKVPVKKDKIAGVYSSYQAAWMIDNDAYKQDDDSDEFYSDGDDEFEPTAARDEQSTICGGGTDESDRGSMTTTSEVGMTDERYDELMDYEAEREHFASVKGLAPGDDLDYPDELDTPGDMPARERFRKYRGLDSFRTSPWDLRDRLPRDYNKIFHIPNFNHFRKRVVKTEDDREGVEPGQYVVLHIKNVQQHLYREHLQTGAKLVVFGLLPHEHKMALLNLVIKSHPVDHDESIKSKDRLIFHVGFRRFANQAIFSEHQAGDKQKFCRYFHPGMTVVASVYAPVTYSPASVLVFRQTATGSQQLVATGSVFSVDADRCVLKRVVLSAHPFKINKRSVVARYMFYQRDDINWFKPIELRTKWGRRGKIKEALGTHGHMKCQFNGHLKSQDTILLLLYKRVFPKWTYDPCVARSPSMYVQTPHCDSNNSDDSGSEDEVTTAAKQALDRVLMPPPLKRVRFD